MGNSNRELQLRKNCKLYAYVLISQDKEVPEYISDCADDVDLDGYDNLIDCVAELAEAIKGLDSDAFERIVNGCESENAKELSHWWDMYQKYIPVPK
jgi:hypothetical protein